jgi:hypothetical protein
MDSDLLLGILIIMGAYWIMRKLFPSVDENNNSNNNAESNYDYFEEKEKREEQADALTNSSAEDIIPPEAIFPDSDFPIKKNKT